MSRSAPTIADLRSCYPETKKKFDSENLWGFLVLRRTSFYPTWLLIRLGFSPNATTMLSLAAGVAGCAILATGKDSLDIVGAVLVNLWNLLDYVDGNIARYKRSESRYGHFLDASVGSLMVVLIGLSAGLGAFFGNGFYLPIVRHLFHVRRVVFIVLALGGAWAYTLRFLLRQTQEQFARIYPSSAIDRQPSRREVRIRKVSSIVDHAISLLPPVLLLDAIISGMGNFVTLYALLFALSAFITLTQLIVAVLERLPRSAYQSSIIAPPPPVAAKDRRTNK